MRTGERPRLVASHDGEKDEDRAEAVKSPESDAFYSNAASSPVPPRVQLI
ncbi:uncharacterized protein PpBr36_11495 [Pyricularia pennisetigena]